MTYQPHQQEDLTIKPVSLHDDGALSPERRTELERLCRDTVERDDTAATFLVRTVAEMNFVRLHMKVNYPAVECTIIVRPVATVAGIERIGKLMTPPIPAGCVEVSAATLDDLLQTIDYRMDNWAGLDKVIRKSDGATLAYTQGRGPEGKVLLHPDFVRETNYTTEE